MCNPPSRSGFVLKSGTQKCGCPLDFPGFPVKQLQNVQKGQPSCLSLGVWTFGVPSRVKTSWGSTTHLPPIQATNEDVDWLLLVVDCFLERHLTNEEPENEVPPKDAGPAVSISKAPLFPRSFPRPAV